MINSGLFSFKTNGKLENPAYNQLYIFCFAQMQDISLGVSLGSATQVAMFVVRIDYQS